MSLVGKRIFIVGSHPLAKYIVGQYEEIGCCVEQQFELFDASFDKIVYDDLYMLADEGEELKAISILETIAGEYNLAVLKDERLLCHLFIQHREMLLKLQSCDLISSIKQKIDVYPFTIDACYEFSVGTPF